jgi:hypothetical protein
MPNSIYGPRRQQQQRPQTNPNSTLLSINQATGILTDLLNAGPQGKQIATQRLAVLISMVELQVKAAR